MKEHNLNDDQFETKKLLKCKYLGCSKKFKSKFNLKSHIRIHVFKK